MKTIAIIDDDIYIGDMLEVSENAEGCISVGQLKLNPLFLITSVWTPLIAPKAL